MSVLVFAVVLCTAPPPPPPPLPDPPAERVDSRSANGRHVVVKRWGDVTVDADGEATVSLGANGRLEVQEREGRTRRHLVMTPGRTTWSVNGHERKFDAEGHAWLKRVLASMPQPPPPPRPTH
jgi:hypothetical protein